MQTIMMNMRHDRKGITHRLHRTLRGLVLASATLAAGALPLAWQPQAAAQSNDAPSQEEELDTLILRNGRVVKGRIIEENESEIRIVVVVAGIEAPTTYRRSEILEVHRGAGSGEGGEETPAKPDKPDKPTQPDPAPRPHTETPEQRPSGDSTDAPLMYVLRLRGHLVGDPVGFEYVALSGRRDLISATSLREALDDARAHNPDVIVIELDADSPSGFDGMFVAQPMYGAIEEAMREGRRVVFWVRRALAGAAFLPFISPEIYFSSRGLMGGVGDLSDFDLGDEVVNEKQISLRLGHAEGRAIQGGYDPVLVRAMARRENWLFVRWEGGEPVYLEHEPRPSDGPGWTLLSDDGEGANKDASVLEQNDVLQLDADWALRLRVSKGTADSVDDLAFMLGYGRDYRVERGKSQRILSDWSQRVAAAADEILRQQEMLEEVDQRNLEPRAVIGRQIGILRRIRGMMTVYAEVFDPGGERRSQIDVQIEQLRLELRNNRNEASAELSLARPAPSLNRSAA